MSDHGSVGKEVKQEVCLSEKDWTKLLSISAYTKIAPAALCRIILRQAMSRYSMQDGVDGNVSQLAASMTTTTHLSDREKEVLSLMIHGISNKEIASVLGIGEQTTKNHITAILRKMKADNRTHAVVLALRQNYAESRTIPTSARR